MDFDALVVIEFTVTLAAFVQGTSGIGFAMIVAPVVALFDPSLLPVVLLILMLPLNVYIAGREFRSIHWGGLAWISGARMVGAPIGAVLLLVSSHSLGVIIGAATLAAALASLLVPAFRPTARSLSAAGIVTGVSETATGIGGPPLALLYQHGKPSELRATVAGCFFVGELMSVGLLGITGQVHGEAIRAAFYLLPALFLGSASSLFTHHRVKGGSLRLGVLIFACVSGAALMTR